MAARPISITVVNNCGTTVKFDNVSHQHGTTPKVTSGSETLTEGAQCTVYAENSGLVGPQGSFSFTFQDGSGKAYNFSYNHPYGSGETYVNVNDPSGYTDKMTENHLAHHDAYCTIELQQLAS